MTFLASALPALLPIAGQVAGGLLGSKAGSSSYDPISAPQISYTPPGFNGGGLNATFGNNGYTVTPDASRNAALGGIINSFDQQTGAISNLARNIAPGYSALRTSLMNTLNNQRTAAIGNLRDNLAQRRVLGSSFAQDALARADQEYQNTAAKIQADTFLQELGASNQLLQEQYNAYRSQFATSLNELNLEAGIASDLTGRAMPLLADIAKTQAQLDLNTAQFNAKQGAEAAAGAGKFFGGIGSQVGSVLGKAFGGSGASASLAASNAAATGASAADLAFAF